eukprot:2821113-Pleurochrysis_carterae.AAC.14
MGCLRRSIPLFSCTCITPPFSSVPDPSRRLMVEYTLGTLLARRASTTRPRGSGGEATWQARCRTSEPRLVLFCGVRGKWLVDFAAVLIAARWSVDTPRICRKKACLRGPLVATRARDVRSDLQLLLGPVVSAQGRGLRR